MSEPIEDERRAIDLFSVVEALCSAGTTIRRRSTLGQRALPLPSRTDTIVVMEAIREVLFPGYFGSSEQRPDTMRYHLGHTLDEIHRRLRIQVKRSMTFDAQTPKTVAAADQQAELAATSLVERLPEIERLVALDAQAAYDGDPAATSTDEAIFCYPGVLAVTNYRVAHELSRLGVPLLPRIISEHAHSVTGIDIHPDACIGQRFFIDHGTGVVIGQTAIIGDRVRIYQGVTLGARSIPRDEEAHPIKGIARHPIIEDDVVVYSGATILGRVTIGKGSVIGGNVWLTRSVPPESRVTLQAPQHDLYSKGEGI